MSWLPITFGVPLFLAAALAAAIPVVLHMINRQKAKDLPFSTLRFLKISVEKTRRRRRIQDVLLLLIRMAVLILIAMGLARPTLTNLSRLWGGTNTAAAIILDNSASMGNVDQGGIRFETGRNAARQILDELAGNNQVSFALAAGPEQPSEGKLDRSQEQARQLLNAAEVTYEKADLGVEVQEAQAVLSKSKAASKQIYVITDLQELSWEGFHAGGGEAEGEQPATAEDSEELTKEEREVREIPVIFIDTNRAPKPNVAVSDVAVEAAVPVAGVPVLVHVELLNASAVPQERHVELHVDGTKEQTSPDLKIEAQSRVKYTFEYTFKRGGAHRGEVRLVGDDGSRFDDRRFFSMEVDQGIPVAVVKAEQHEIPYLEDTYYVERALMPEETRSWAISTTTLVRGDLLSEPLAGYTVVFCVNLPALDADSAERLASYVARGGNLIWFCGDNVQPESYNHMDQEDGNRLLPAPLGVVRQPDPGGERDSWNIAFLDKEHPALGHLVEPASLYQSVLVYKDVTMKVGDAPDARVLARLDDGEPLIVQRKVEEGSVTMIGTGAHVGWTNLPLKTIFLPLLARMTFDLAGAEKTRYSGLAGQPIVLQFDEQLRPSTVQVNSPSGETDQFETVAEDGSLLDEFRFDKTHPIGIYELGLLSAVRRTQVLYSVNVAPDESSPAKISPEELEKRFGGTPLVFAEDPEDLTGTFELLRKGNSLWSTFLWLVLVGLVFETLISNFFSPKKEDEELQKVAPGMRRLAKKGRTEAA